MRLIDADALPRFGNRKGLIHSGDVDNAPTVDAVEVVRCKDCKWFEPEDEDGDCWCYYDNDTTCRDGYCSMGEKKDDNT